ncbi:MULTISPECIES: septum formation initiator family protein [Peptoniphilus]|jgi:cell division protein ftsL|uniref:FtsB family cell division protein n=1 Tax=Peptoniphilus TaxID=162289 RepID=UPI0008D97B51|nr:MULTISPECIES: septum formation initiator family protein [Peptoniphilus]MBS6610238.1 septum formation initiator family protein [Peptoniphilus harei]MDU1043735.1 septum formation initiator family protein [Peptoniphilus rhinitidis]MDU1955505.1 septum formation initiator family protein [Peptoniphilus lacydonensis]MDU2109494.1 septum formation initiator family protein [Peptoniphilus lacydonensis]MDU2115521.1 septum formation initiator family protein [Peptoniphilus lacydonensis]
MNVKRKKFPLALAIIILISALYGSVKIGKSISLKKQKLEIISENNREISNLKLEIDNLNSELENSSSTDFIEKVAREELGMVKPREVVYVDKNKDKTSKTEGLK